MNGVDTIFSALSLLGGGGVSGVGSTQPTQPVPPAQPTAPASGQTPLAADSFSQGQWWKNRSRARGDETQAGQWPATVALRAYADRATDAVGVSAAGAETAAAGEQAAAAAATPAADGTSADQKSQQDGGVAAQGEDRGGAASSIRPTKPDGKPMSRAEELLLSELRQADTEVRAHEQAHLTAAGAYARSGPSFQYRQGPDGQEYAVAGEVSIDTGKESDPAKTIQKMEVVRAAALAPASPSSQDLRVAAAASSAIADAEAEVQLQQLATEEAARKQGVAAQGAAAGAAAGAEASSSNGSATAAAASPAGAAAGGRIRGYAAFSSPIQPVVTGANDQARSPIDLVA